jgi:hypothetical protein
MNSDAHIHVLRLLEMVSCAAPMYVLQVDTAVVHLQPRANTFDVDFDTMETTCRLLFRGRRKMVRKVKPKLAALNASNSNATQAFPFGFCGRHTFDTLRRKLDC